MTCGLTKFPGDGHAPSCERYSDSLISNTSHGRNGSCAPEVDSESHLPGSALVVALTGVCGRTMSKNEIDRAARGWNTPVDAHLLLLSLVGLIDRAVGLMPRIGRRRRDALCARLDQRHGRGPELLVEVADRAGSDVLVYQIAALRRGRYVRLCRGARPGLPRGQISPRGARVLSHARVGCPTRRQRPVCSTGV